MPLLESRPAAAPVGPRPSPVWGLPLSPLTTGQVLDAVDRMVAEGVPRFVVTANLNYAMLSERSEALRQVNRDAALVTADGMPLVWAARLRGRPVPGRVTGADLVPAVCGRAAERGYRVFLLGGAEGVAARAAANLSARFPGLAIVGVESPPFRPLDEAENAALVERVKAARPDVLLLASSQPRGEIWLWENCRRLGVPVAFQVGASIDFAAGRVARAPRWMQRAGLEWAFRLAREPKRLVGRYARNAAFLARAVARDLFAAGANRGGDRSLMRILYSHCLDDDRHPAARMAAEVASGLRGLGHEVRLHRSAGPPSGGEAGPGRSAPSALRRALWFTRALSRNAAMLRRDEAAVREFRPDVVLARQDAYCFAMPLAARRRAVPLVTYADAPVAYETRLFDGSGRWHPPGLVERIERATLRASRAVVAVSEPAARRLRRYGAAAPVHAVPNGVDPTRFPEFDGPERSARRARLGLTAPGVVVFAGSFNVFHGIDRLRDLILATAPRADTQWLLIGDGPERAALRAAVGDRPEVVFLGRRPADEVGGLLALCDVAVAPHPRVDGDFYFCPLKVLEYAAAGCAVVASDQGDVPRLLDDGRAGSLVAESDPSAWAAAVARLLDEPARARALGRHARRHVLENYTWEKTAARVAAVLEAAAAPETGARSLASPSGPPVRPRLGMRKNVSR